MAKITFHSGPTRFISLIQQTQLNFFVCHHAVTPEVEKRPFGNAHHHKDNAAYWVLLWVRDATPDYGWIFSVKRKTINFLFQSIKPGNIGHGKEGA